MAVIQNLDVNLRSQIAQFQQGMGTARKEIDMLRSKVDSVSKSSGGSSGGGILGSLLGTGIASQIAAVAGPLAILGGLGWGVKLAAEAESATIAFTTMLKSGDQAKILVGQLQKFAQETPFETAELTSATKSLIAFGVSAKDSIPTLRRIGDVSSGIGAPIGEIAELYGKAKVQGRLFAQDINQLTGRGIPIIQELAKQFGVTDGEVKAMVESGKVNFGHLEKAFISLTSQGGQFEGMMKNQSMSLGGLWSSLSDSFSMVFKEIGDVIIETFNLKGGIGLLTQATDYIKATIQSLKPVVMAVRDIFIAYWTQIFNVVGSGASIIMTALQPVVDFFKGVFGNTLMEVRDNVLSVMYGIEWSITNASKIWEASISGMAYSMTRLWEDTKHIVLNLISIFEVYGRFNTEFWGNIVTNIGNAMGEIWEFIESGGTSGLEFTWSPMVKGFQGAFDEIKQIAKREEGELEKTLRQDWENKAGAVQEGLGAFVNKKLDELKKDATGPLGELTGDSKVAEEAAAAKTKGKGTVKVAGVEKGSVAAFQAILDARKSTPELKEAQKQTKAAEESVKKLDEINTTLKEGQLSLAPI